MNLMSLMKNELNLTKNISHISETGRLYTKNICGAFFYKIIFTIY